MLGDAAVLTTAEQLAPYGKIMMSVPETAHMPSAALLATSVEQVQQIVGVCNKHKVPIWPISTGKNLGYGSAAPAERGEVVLDLKLMNRIIEVDKDLCYALVEPGVTYKQLHDHIRENNLGLWLGVRHLRPSPGPWEIRWTAGLAIRRTVSISSLPAECR